MKPVNTRIDVLAIVSRVVLFSIIWWILADGVVSSWWIGAPAVLFAVVASIALLPRTCLVWYEFLRFVPWFLKRSLLGGADVAWRAFHPSMPIFPSLIEYPLQLPPGLPRVIMANTVSLLPGTLSAELDHGVLQVHVLDSRRDIMTELESVEQCVARLCSTSLSDAS